MKKPDLCVVISLDVEEEGLFSGHYPSRNPTVENVGRLRDLAPLSRDLGFPLTLFCAYSVFQDVGASRTIAWMHEICGAEIAAHLHHWSTPPYTCAGQGKPERTADMPPALLEARLETLLRAGENFSGSPLRSFRMGRWDLKSSLLPMLAGHGILVDSSICPLRAHAGGADHFLAPADPWLASFPEGHIVEAPITQLPIARPLAAAWHKLWHKKNKMMDSFHFLGAMSANPLWHGDAVMRMAVKEHVKRGGRILSFFWHSSEMLPGASPHVRDENDAKKLLKRITFFCEWLNKNFNARGITACNLADPQWNFPKIPVSPERDW